MGNGCVGSETKSRKVNERTGPRCGAIQPLSSLMQKLNQPHGSSGKWRTPDRGKVELHRLSWRNSTWSETTSLFLRC